MKRLLGVCFVIVLFFCVSIPQKQFLQIINIPSKSTYSLFVTKQYVQTMAGVDKIQNGSLSILSCDGSLAKSLYNEHKNDILGQQLQFTCDKNGFFSYLSNLNCQVVYNETVGEIINFYCFNKNLKDFVILPQGKVNLQLSYNLGVVTVGSPLIVGSY